MNTNKTILIEQTSKKYKAMLAIGFPLFLIGMWIAGHFQDNPDSYEGRPWLYLVTASPGIILMLYASVRAWWTNG